MAFLCISLNNSSLNTIHLMDGELIDIDKYTTSFDSAKSILKEYPEKIEDLNHVYDIYDGNINNVKVRIFLQNDKEKFVMYKRHLVAFRMIISDIEFLKYAISYDSTLFDKRIREMLDNPEYIDNIIHIIKEYVSDCDEDDYYKTVRKICNQYNHYIEDYPELELLNIDELYKNYLKRLKKSKLSRENAAKKASIKRRENYNPFAVFEHPNFALTYGKAIDKSKPIFILGDKMGKESKHQYEDLFETCSKCFENKIFYPMNANVATPLNQVFASLYKESLLVIVNGNGINDELDRKIRYACKHDITVLILSDDSDLLDLYDDRYSNYDTVIVKEYKFDDIKYKKDFVDIAVGIYINQYKKMMK